MLKAFLDTMLYFAGQKKLHAHLVGGRVQFPFSRNSSYTKGRKFRSQRSRSNRRKALRR